MGDIADWLINQYINGYDSYGDYRGGYQRAARCSRCGSHAVRWEDVDGTWVLVSSSTGARHFPCPIIPENEFEEVE